MVITEDYIGFETAKLLKEKGFDVWGDGSLGSATKIWKEYGPNGKLYDCSMGLPSRKAFPAPTLQMTMKWLREVHNIHIAVIVAYHHIPRRYEAHIMKLETIDDFILNQQVDFASYEEACEAGIRYCLEKLI